MNEEFVKLLMMSLAGGQGASLGSTAGLGDDPFDIMSSSQITRPPGQLTNFNLLLSGITGLMGNQVSLPDTLLQHFHLTPNTKGSQLFQALVDQNTQNVGSLVAHAQQAQRDRLSSVFGEKGFGRRVLHSVFGNDDVANWLQGTIGQGGFAGQMLTSFLDPMISEMTGDNPMGLVNQINARSIGMVSGMYSTRGGRQATPLDVLGEDFENARNAASSLVYDATRDIRSRGKTNGVSQQLVGNILARAVRDGSLEKEFDAKAVQDVIDKLPNDGENGVFTRLKEQSKNGNLRFQSVFDAQKDLFAQQKEIQRQINAAETRRTEALAQRGDAREAGDEDAAEKANIEARRAEDTVNRLKESLASVVKDTGELGKVIGIGGEDFLKAVTGAVDSLEDLFGDEEKAAKALQQLTGDQGLTNKKVAEQIKRQVDTFKLTAMAASLDPTQAGAMLANNMQAVSTYWNTNRFTGSAAAGQIALAQSTATAREAARISDPAERQRYIEAQQAMAAEVSGSEGERASYIFEYLKEQGKFKDRGGLEKTIERLMQSTNPADFQKAKKMLLSVLGNGNLDLGSVIFNSPQAMADLMNQVTPKGSREAAERTTNWNRNEVADIMEYKLQETEIADAARLLGDAGYTQAEADKIFAESSYDSLQDTLRNLSYQAYESGDRAEERRLDALQFQQEKLYKAELERNGGDEEAARRFASERIFSQLNADQQKQAQKDQVKAFKAAVVDKATLGYTHGGYDAFGITGDNYYANSDFIKELKDVGVAGNFDISVGGLVQYGSKLAEYVGSGKVLGKDGKFIDEDKATAFKEQIHEHIKNKDFAGLYSTIKSFKETIDPDDYGLRETLSGNYFGTGNTYWEDNLSESEKEELSSLRDRGRELLNQLREDKNPYVNVNGEVGEDSLKRDAKRIKELTKQEKAGTLDEEGKTTLTKLRKDVSAAQELSNVNANMAFLEEEGQKGTYEQRMAAAAATAKELGMKDQDAAHTVARHASVAKKAIDLGLTKEELGQVEEKTVATIKEKEEKGAAANAGVGEKFLKFLQGSDLDKFTKSVAGSEEKLREFQNFISKMLEFFGFETEHTDAAKGETGRAGQPPQSGGLYGNAPAGAASHSAVVLESNTTETSVKTEPTAKEPGGSRGGLMGAAAAVGTLTRSMNTLTTAVNSNTDALSKRNGSAPATTTPMPQ